MAIPPGEVVEPKFFASARKSRNAAYFSLKLKYLRARDGSSPTQSLSAACPAPVSARAIRQVRRRSASSWAANLVSRADSVRIGVISIPTSPTLGGVGRAELVGVQVVGRR